MIFVTPYHDIFLGKKDETTLIDYLSSSKFVQASSNNSKLVNKLKTAVENQSLYELEQILRTISSRFINRSDKVEALIGLLYYGSVYLIERNDHISGQDIGFLFLEATARFLRVQVESEIDDQSRSVLLSDVTYHVQRQTENLDICRKLASIAVHLPDTELCRQKFIADALKLLTPSILSRDLLHETLANWFYSVSEYVSARDHFLHSACLGSDVLATLLADVHSHLGARSEVDLFIAQFILQYLCIQQPTDSPPVPGQSRQKRTNDAPANLGVSKKSIETIADIVDRIFRSYIDRAKHPDITPNLKPFRLPLLNFIYLLISLLVAGTKSQAEAFKFLVDTYERAWDRDPNYQSYLNRIGVLYFGLADPTKLQQQQAGGSGGGGFFNNILMSLLDATDDEEEDTVREPARNIMSYDDPD